MSNTRTMDERVEAYLANLRVRIENGDVDVPVADPSTVADPLEEMAQKNLGGLPLGVVLSDAHSRELQEAVSVRACPDVSVRAQVKSYAECQFMAESYFVRDESFDAERYRRDIMQAELCRAGVCLHNYQDDRHCICGRSCGDIPYHTQYIFGGGVEASFSGHGKIIRNLLLAGWKGIQSLAESNEERAALMFDNVFCYLCVHSSGKAFILRMSNDVKPETYGLGVLATGVFQGLPIATVRTWDELVFWMDEHDFPRSGPAWAQDSKRAPSKNTANIPSTEGTRNGVDFTELAKQGLEMQMFPVVEGVDLPCFRLEEIQKHDREVLNRGEASDE